MEWGSESNPRCLEECAQMAYDFNNSTAPSIHRGNFPLVFQPVLIPGRAFIDGGEMFRKGLVMILGALLYGCASAQQTPIEITATPLSESPTPRIIQITATRPPATPTPVMTPTPTASPTPSWRPVPIADVENTF